MSALVSATGEPECPEGHECSPQNAFSAARQRKPFGNANGEGSGGRAAEGLSALAGAAGLEGSGRILPGSARRQTVLGDQACVAQLREIAKSKLS